MKVLSIIEPFASLIKNKRKFIETRSWKTFYRGELYIHASSKKIPKEWKNNHHYMIINETNYGNIICKCKLVDCIYIDQEFIGNIKENNYQEYLLGIYEIGRYAWILEDIETIDKMEAKGHLGIWNYQDKD